MLPSTSPVFLQENVGHRGYKPAVLQQQRGLDYSHCVLAVSALARLHAASFCLRRDSGGQSDLAQAYPVLEGEVLDLPVVSKETIMR